jgi:hypothetical protein
VPQVAEEISLASSNFPQPNCKCSAKQKAHSNQDHSSDRQNWKVSFGSLSSSHTHYGLIRVIIIGSTKWLCVPETQNSFTCISTQNPTTAVKLCIATVIAILHMKNLRPREVKNFPRFQNHDSQPGNLLKVYIILFIYFCRTGAIFKLLILLFFFFLFVVLGFELQAFTSSHSTSPVFHDRVFCDRDSGTICLG